ncbi:MAG: penicillin-binding protein 2 [Balneolaceae bacterium]|nr:penicillin-binding protein 2 [Balneolaceae bacterium]MCH8547272.1 penicillin-binding protein 2 [Balneolaceae bacterium]
MHSGTDTNGRVKTSIRILQGIIIIGFLVMLGRIVQLQIIDHEKYTPLSMQNSIRMEMVNPARGLILDRKERILVDNQPIYSITITPANFRMENIELLAELLNMDPNLVLNRVREAQQYSWHRTSRLFTEVPFNVFSNIQENIWQLPGIGHKVESKRNYPTDLRASHIMGYLREASREEYLRSDRIRLGDRIGKSGLEMVYEDYLRGELGSEYIQVNAYGREIGSFNNGELNISPTKGADLITTIDLELQELAEKLMEGKLGGVVAIDPKTGGILSMVSAPQYDVERLAGRMDIPYWQSINTDTRTPLFNRAISSRQPPGSTFKPFMGLAGIELGLVNPDTEIYNSGAYVRGRRYNDLADPGYYNFEKALQYSSNTYFLWIMDRLAQQGKLNKWANLLNDFGFGHRNNIDLPFETAGIIPDSTYMNRNFGERQWGIGDLMSLGIGQGMVSLSPLQMAVATASIANDGYRVQPHLVSQIRHANGDVDQTNPERHKIEWIREENLNAVKRGMKASMQVGGTNYFAYMPEIEIHGKTGTAQNPHGRNHGWFIAYAPADDPQIAIAVLMENSGFGSVSASPIASLMIEQYLTGETTRPHIMNHVLNFSPRDADQNEEPDEEDIEELLEEQAP